MKKIVYYVALIIVVIALTANSAQPGVWNAGGSGSFTLLYPEDSVAYKKIQMQSEKIYMQLYKGFAVVKGNYFYNNTSADTLTIKVGYPINNVFTTVGYGSYANEVFVDDLYKTKALVNDKPIQLFKKPKTATDNWYVWNVSFPPNTITKFTVYFLVNTNNAQVLQGYNKDYKNAFIYLIETGSLWKSPIENGDFYIKLEDNIAIDEAKASVPSTLKINDKENILTFSMQDYGKEPDPNFVMTYGDKIENFDFESKVKKSENYFTNIDDFSATDFSKISFSEINLASVYEVDGISNNAINYLFYFVIYGLPIAAILFVITLGIALYKKFKKQ